MRRTPRQRISIFQNGISLFDKTCLRDSRTSAYSRRHYPEMSSLTTRRRHQQPASVTDGAGVRMYVRAHTSVFAVTLPAHHLGLCTDCP
ncbi:hypothetical protein QQF64_008959 [Cirrhinus molitorella]|uniref:Uncharacterized protein n=1 Tax=Cirrhinus molitorella TaxID=172907 RepID=A0ABR3MB33_9TELE